MAPRLPASRLGLTEGFKLGSSPLPRRLRRCLSTDYTTSDRMSRSAQREHRARIRAGMRVATLRVDLRISVDLHISTYDVTGPTVIPESLASA